jgi:hypothetical protein
VGIEEMLYHFLCSSSFFFERRQEDFAGFLLDEENQKKNTTQKTIATKNKKNYSPLCHCSTLLVVIMGHHISFL